MTAALIAEPILNRADLRKMATDELLDHALFTLGESKNPAAALVAERLRNKARRIAETANGSTEREREWKDFDLRKNCRNCLWLVKQWRSN